MAYLLHMNQLDKFVGILKEEFPDDRLTYQKAIPTFHPENAEEASALFKLANRHKQPLYITGFGNNIDPIGQPFDGLLSVRTDRLNDVIEVAPADFFVTVGAGYPLREINLRLKSDNLFLPQSDLPYVGSVGGALAVGLSSDFHGHDFPLKKYFIRAEIVTPQGEIVKPGSVCFKSVSGYDVVRIFAGSWGLLGLVVSATFRVMPVTAAEEFVAMKQKAVDRSKLVDGISESNQSIDAEYSRKVKRKFDPIDVLPLVELGQ